MIKLRCSGIRMLERFQVILTPWIVPRDLNLINRNIFRLRPMTMNGDRQPLFATGRLDLIAIAPTALIILDIIVKNKQVGAADLVKIAAPRNIGGLENNNFHLPTTLSIMYVGRSMLR